MSFCHVMVRMHLLFAEFFVLIMMMACIALVGYRLEMVGRGAMECYVIDQMGVGHFKRQGTAVLVPTSFIWVAQKLIIIF